MIDVNFLKWQVEHSRGNLKGQTREMKKFPDRENYSNLVRPACWNLNIEAREISINVR